MGNEQGTEFPNEDYGGNGGDQNPNQKESDIMCKSTNKSTSKKSNQNSDNQSNNYSFGLNDTQLSSKPSGQKKDHPKSFGGSDMPSEYEKMMMLQQQHMLAQMSGGGDDMNQLQEQLQQQLQLQR
jgi:hypothetical protein